jgi:hypothetical protein
VARTFEWLLNEVGAKISIGAHFWSSEKAFFLKSLLEVRKGKMEFFDILRIRQIVGPDSRLPGKKSIPVAWNRGPALSNELRWWKGDPRLGASLASFYLHFEFVRECQNLGLEPFLPRYLGGVGFPHPKGGVFVCSRLTRQMIAEVTRNDASLRGLTLEHLLSRVWSVGDTWDSCSVEETLTWARTFFPDLLDVGPTYGVVGPDGDFWTPNFKVEVLNEQVSLEVFQAQVRYMRALPGNRRLVDFLEEFLSLRYNPWVRKKSPRVPSLAEISFRFREIRRGILTRHKYAVPKDGFYDPGKLQGLFERPRNRFWVTPIGDLPVPRSSLLERDYRYFRPGEILKLDS